MKVLAISDLHLSINNPKPMDIFGGAWDNYLENIESSWNESVSEDDIVLIAGDISWAMTLENAKPDLDYIGKLKGHKIMIRGNHDYWWKSVSNVRSILKHKTYVVQNDSIKIGQYVICGSRGWTTPISNFENDNDKKIYARELIRMELALQDMTKKREAGDKAIALIHYPPFNAKLEHSDFTELFTKYNVDAVIYGHLHGKDSRVERLATIAGTSYYLTSCDLIGNKLVQIF